MRNIDAPLMQASFCIVMNHKLWKPISKIPYKQQLVEKNYNTFKYLANILALNKDDFDIYTKDIYPAELSLNKANSDDKERPCLDLTIHVNNGPNIHVMVIFFTECSTHPLG